MEITIKAGDVLQIAGVQYEVKHIETCKDCCLNDTRTCGCLDPAITCGEKAHLGFRTFGYRTIKVTSNKNIPNSKRVRSHA